MRLSELLEILYTLKLTPDLHVVFKVMYVHDFVTELCRQQAEVTTS